jgi:hypothetical protein
MHIINENVKTKAGSTGGTFDVTMQDGMHGRLCV